MKTGKRGRGRGRQRERERVCQAPAQLTLFLLFPGSLWEARVGPNMANRKGRCLGALGLAHWTLAIFDIPPKDRHLPLSQLPSSEPHLPHLWGYCSRGNYQRPVQLGVYEPWERLAAGRGGKT